MRKADYSEIAGRYDAGRALSGENMSVWLGLVAKYSGATRGARALDLGCGTGRFSLPMARKLGLAVTGADTSQEMLATARDKDTDSAVTWDRQDAAVLTYADAAFDVVFMSHLLHHVDGPADVIAECHRVLRPGGVVLIRYGAMEQIRHDVEHTFFPGALLIDEPRTPTVTGTEAWLRTAGFSEVRSEKVVQQTYPDAASHLAAARLKNTSVLTMVPQVAFEEGIRRLEGHAQAHPDDPWLLFDRLTLTVGRREVT